MDYMELKREVEGAGLLERQYGYYAFKIALLVFSLGASIAILIYVNSFAVQILNAAFLAFVFVRFGLLMHDADHHQVFKSKRKNEILGILAGNLVLGLSSGRWAEVHNTHHAAPNDADVDPDVRIGVLAYSEGQALEKKGIARFITRHQAYLWFPLLSLQTFRIRLNYIRELLRSASKGKIRYLPLEASALIVNTFAYFGLVFYALNVWQAAAFIATHYALTGLYMTTIFATNHKGMPMISGKRKPDFMEMQIITTRNVRNSPLIDFWTGGLNNQIEHHIFTSMPRNNLSKAKEYVKKYCEKNSIEYYETGFFESYKEILQNFHRVSAVLRRPKRVASRQIAA